jgi:hypothetical protein
MKDVDPAFQQQQGVGIKMYPCLSLYETQKREISKRKDIIIGGTSQDYKPRHISVDFPLCAEGI